MSKIDSLVIKNILKVELKSNFVLTFIISIFLHFIVLFLFVSPDLRTILALEANQNGNKSLNRDIIVNINQNNKRKINRKTLLSDKDSVESGYLTKKKGDRFLNNSMMFKLKKGEKGDRNNKGKSNSKNSLLLASKSDVAVVIDNQKSGDGKIGDFHELKIPDKNNVTRNNSIFYSSSGTFSFNTAKFKHFKYFNNMKNKISSNWYPPIMANVTFGGYAPGRTRIMAIASQQVKIYFIMNRFGKIIEAKILDSDGNEELDKSCLDAIINSKSFGEVPKDMLKGGNSIVIPFIFGYYIQ